VYIEPKSIASIQDGIRKSLQKSKNDNLKNHIRKNYLWKHIALKIAEVYKAFQ